MLQTVFIHSHYLDILKMQRMQINHPQLKLSLSWTSNHNTRSVSTCGHCKKTKQERMKREGRADLFERLHEVRASNRDNDVDLMDDEQGLILHLEGEEGQVVGNVHLFPHCYPLQLNTQCKTVSFTAALPIIPCTDFNEISACTIFACTSPFQIEIQ